LRGQLDRRDERERSSTSTASAADIEDRFLKLLVTQMKNRIRSIRWTTRRSHAARADQHGERIDKLNATMNALSSSFIAGNRCRRLR